MKPLMINATDRNIIITGNYKFYFTKLPILKGIKIQNDVLTKAVKAHGIETASTISGIIATF